MFQTKLHGRLARLELTRRCDDLLQGMVSGRPCGPRFEPQNCASATGPDVQSGILALAWAVEHYGADCLKPQRRPTEQTRCGALKMRKQM